MTTIATATLLTPDRLTAANFDHSNKAAEVRDLFDWADQFFGMRGDLVANVILPRIEALLESQTGKAVILDDDNDNRDALQAQLSPEALERIWSRAIR